MDLITRDKWGARKRKYKVAADMTAHSTCHYNGPDVVVAGKKTWDHSKCASLVRGIQNFHMDVRGWSDIAYNFVICPHGYTFEGRGINVVNGANGTNSGNRTSHTIMCLAGEGNPFTDAEKKEFRQCVEYIVKQAGAKGGCIGHRDWHSTACPGDARYKWVHDGMPVVGSKPSDVQVPVIFGDWPFREKKLIKRGSEGSVVSYLQRVIKVKGGGDIQITGGFGENTEKRVKDLQRTFDLEEDGKVGPDTWKAVDYLATH